MPAQQPSTAISLRQHCLEYWIQSRRPLAALAFVLPLLLLYEGGLLILGAAAVRNGADVWLRQILDLVGFGQYFLLPALTVALLLGWHYVRHDRWRLSTSVLLVMFAECAVLGLVLVAVGRLQGSVARNLVNEPVLVEGMVSAHGLAFVEGPVAIEHLVVEHRAVVGRVLGFVGAGVYEEMLFRLLLLPAVVLCAVRLGAERTASIAGAVLLTSLVFSLAHYVGPRGETFEVFSFSFRLAAGGFFAMLFVYRGFGIAAGTHALYDIFVSFG